MFETLALEALPEDLFWQIVCLLIVVGFVVGGVISAIRGD